MSASTTRKSLRLPPRANLFGLLAEARRQGTVPAETPESFIRRLVHVGEANVRVIQGYAPESLAAPVSSVCARNQGRTGRSLRTRPAGDEDHGWSTAIGQSVEIHEVARRPLHDDDRRGRSSARSAHWTPLRPAPLHRTAATTGCTKIAIPSRQLTRRLRLSEGIPLHCNTFLTLACVFACPPSNLLHAHEKLRRTAPHPRRRRITTPCPHSLPDHVPHMPPAVPPRAQMRRTARCVGF